MNSDINTPIGSCVFSDCTIFSFHAIKTITTGEGGAIMTNNDDLAKTLCRLRDHGLVRKNFRYELTDPSLNLRMNGMSAALGNSQLQKLPYFLRQRRYLAQEYDALLRHLSPHIKPVHDPLLIGMSWHLYTVQINYSALNVERSELMAKLQAVGIGTQVHYIPLHQQSYYSRRYGKQSLPGAEHYYEQVLALPLFVAMTKNDVTRVVQQLSKALNL